MLTSLRWLFRIGGVLPTGGKSDKYFVIVPLFFPLTVMFSTVYSSTDNFSDELNVMNDFLFCISGMYLVLKSNISKQQFIALTKRCFEPRNMDETVLVTMKVFELLVVVCFGITMGARIPIQIVNRNSFMESSLYDFTMALLYIPIVLHVVMVRHMTARFAAINDHLRLVAEAISDRSIPVDNLRADLSSVCRTHANLREIIGQINSYFGLYNVIILANRVVCPTLLAYSFLISLRDPERSFRTIDYLIFFTVAASLLIHCDVCYNCSDEAQETVRIAHEIVDLDTPVQILEEIEDFSLTMFSNPVVFTAGGVFNLDRSLITKITLATATCLIIAIQLTDLKSSVPPVATNTDGSSVTSFLTTHQD